MKKILRFVKTHWYEISIVLILIIATLLRFWSYTNRWGLAYDQARDAIVARYALEHFKLPLLGPFSSAGPFQTGVEWYWFLILATGIFPFAIITPWVILTLIYILFVYVMIRVASMLVDRKFAIIAGIFAAISLAQIDQSANLTNPSLVPIFALFAIWAMLLYSKTNRTIFLFLEALCAGISASIHLQGVGLLFLLIFTIILTKTFQYKKILIAFCGFILPFFPLFISDLEHRFFNIHGMMQYYLHDQYSVPLDSLGRRWKSFLGGFIPGLWTYIIGGNSLIGYLSIVLFGVFLVVSVIQKKITKEWMILLGTFLFSIFLIRYAHTPLYYGYVVFLHPFIILFTAFAIYQLIRYTKFVGVLFLVCIIFFTLQKDLKNISSATNDTSYKATAWSMLLEKTYPGKKFRIYEHGYESGGLVLPLMMFLDHDKKLGKDGVKIGFGSSAPRFDPFHPEIKGNNAGFILRDLDSSSSAELKNETWAEVTPENVYASIEEWH